MQKVLVMTTSSGFLRSTAQGWRFENGDCVRQAVERECYKYNYNDIPIGLIEGEYNFYYCYTTPLHAIGDGWKLLAPPQKINLSEKQEEFEWWFTKD